MIEAIKKLLNEGNFNLVFGMGEHSYDDETKRIVANEGKIDPLKFVKLDGLNNFFYLSDDIYPLVVHIDEENDILTIYFSPTHYNRLFVDLPGFKDEEIYEDFESNINLKNQIYDSLIGQDRQDYVSSKNYYVSINNNSDVRFEFKEDVTKVSCYGMPRSITIIKGKNKEEILSKLEKYVK